jgi:hypothetical protein
MKTILESEDFDNFKNIRITEIGRKRMMNTSNITYPGSSFKRCFLCGKEYFVADMECVCSGVGDKYFCVKCHDSPKGQAIVKELQKKVFHNPESQGTWDDEVKRLART